MSRRRAPKWTQAEAEAAIKAWKASGLSVEAFSARAGFHRERIYRWRRRLEGDRSRQKPRMIPVRVITPAEAGDVMEVVLPGGVTVRVRGGFDAEAFARLIRVLQC